MSNEFKWGIIGLGNIAKQFATGLSSAEGCKLHAVASRNLDKANEFGEKFDANQCYGSYEEMILTGEVDAIYVASPHTHHLEGTMLCLENNIPVLCEKPLAVNAKQAQEMFAKAKEKNVFLMEAVWTRFFPLMVELRKLLKDNAIGEVRMVQADFGFRAGVNPDGRLFNLDLAGGGLLDVGIYTLSMASMILGKPKRIESMADIGSTGVDEQNAVILGYEGGAMAVLTSAIRTQTNHELTIYGTEGSIRVNTAFWKPTSMAIKSNGKEETIEYPVVGNGYNYEAIEVMNCVQGSKLQSEIIPWDESVAVMETMDDIRKQWGLVYPCEN
ncbi:MAG: dehydrogenase [Planctomycetota bacterium]|nr:MAG: dehydrogenase [Planctomycetota bacterium]